VDSTINQEGLEGFRRLVEYLESLPADPDLSVFDPLVYVLEHESKMFILDDADVTCPTLAPWVKVFVDLFAYDEHGFPAVSLKCVAPDYNLACSSVSSKD